MARKKSPVVTAPSEGSFVTGLTIGMFIGALGFYIYNTKGGSSLKTALQREWDVIKTDLHKEGIIDSPDLSVLDIVRQHLGAITRTLDELSAVSKQGIRSKSAPPSNQKKFLGIK
jgi:hypothetical protein